MIQNKVSIGLTNGKENQKVNRKYKNAFPDFNQWRRVFLSNVYSTFNCAERRADDN